MNLPAILLALGVLSQGVLPLLHGGLGLRAGFQVALLSAALAAFTAQLWRVRERLSPHADMMLLMAGFGGLGMLLGGWRMDSLPVCHVRPLSGGLEMSSAMLAAGLLPALRWSRCLAIARQSNTLAATLLLDTGGMLAGMFVAHALCAPLRFEAPALAVLVHHAAMSAGMLAGMAVAMRLPFQAPRLTRASI